jgi:hypothetical protein
MTELLFMSLKRWLPLGVINRITIQHAVLADKTPFDFAKPDLMAELGVFVGLPSSDDVGMWLEDADQFFCCRYRFAAENSPSGLLQHLYGPGHEGLQGFNELMTLRHRCSLQFR